MISGYLFDFPFLTEKCKVVVDGNRVMPLYKHLIHMEFPTLCFIGLPFTVLPFPMFHFQVHSPPSQRSTSKTSLFNRLSSTKRIEISLLFTEKKPKIAFYEEKNFTSSSLVLFRLLERDCLEVPKMAWVVD